MKFRFCGDLDCPDWVLAEISVISMMTPQVLDVVVDQIVGYCLDGNVDYAQLSGIADKHSEGNMDIKGAIAAIHFILTNAAKSDVDYTSLVQEVQQLGLPKASSDAIALKFNAKREILRTKFAQDSYRISKLVSAEWRVDQIIAQSESEEAAANNDPLVHLKLKVDSGLPMKDREAGQAEGLHDVAFELTAEKLDVLIYELAQAQKLMRNIK